MFANSVHPHRNAPRAAAERAVAAVSFHEVDRDMPGILVPRTETQVVVRYGPVAQGGLDMYVLGARQQVHRKVIRGGQRTLVARLRLGTDTAVLGVPASAISGNVLALEDLWGPAARKLVDQLGCAPDMPAAAEVLERAISQRLVVSQARNEQSRFVLDAAERLVSANVETVASDLCVSARHLRRVFRDALGVSPKQFARLERFRHALRVGREHGDVGWANVAAAVGYYDQAHMIAEFRAIAGVTPSELVKELRAAPQIG